MADEHIQVPPHQSPAGGPPTARPGDPITTQAPAPGPNGELPRPAPVTAPAADRPSLARTLLELVWPSTGAHVAQADSVREVVETVVFVVVLVLLLKSFAAEAFVIPTGSMAETLWGYQKVVVCPKCKYQFPVNCSSEVDPQDAQHSDVASCVCPNCRQKIRLINPDPRHDAREPLSPRPGDDVVEIRDPGWDSGDRVLVAKSLYELGLMHPDRRDVVVFKFPGDENDPNAGPQRFHVPMNYIKRLIGLGGETIGIYYGKLYVMSGDEPDDRDQAVRAEHPEELWKHKYMHEDDFAELLQLGDLQKFKQLLERKAREEPEGRYPHLLERFNRILARGESPHFEMLRKRPDKILALKRLVYDNDHPAADLGKLPRWKPEDGSGWTADNANGFRLAPAQGAGLGWVRYGHLLRPGPGDPNPPRPQLITDFMGYNGYENGRHPGAPPQNWVGDLILECEATVDQPAGELVLELSKGVDRFRAKFDLITGTCTLVRVHDGKEEKLEQKPTGLRGGTHQVRFANVDDRLTVWVDGSLPFGDGVPYEPPGQRGPTAANDLQPASVGAQGAGVGVHKIKLWRDTYYTLDPHSSDSGRAGETLGGDDWADPARWEVLKKLPAKTLYVQPGHYLCLGDNSPESSDGRSWGTVPERLMLGRALLVYYPFYFPSWPLESPVNRVGPIR